MKEEPPSVPAISRSRLEVLCDGVFAIAMTILVLELKVPDLVDRHSIGELARELTAAAYLRSGKRWLRSCLVLSTMFVLFLTQALASWPSHQ